MDESVEIAVSGDKTVRVSVHAVALALATAGVGERTYTTDDGGLVSVRVSRVAPPPSNVGSYETSPPDPRLSGVTGARPDEA